MNREEWLQDGLARLPPNMPDKIDVSNTGCWVWNRPLKSNGYGQVCVKTRMMYPHRVVYETYYGSIPEGFWVDHLCRNRACVNPLHLEATTPRENTVRGQNSYKFRGGICENGHDVTVAGVRRDPNFPGAGQCRECGRLNSRAVILTRNRAAKALGISPTEFKRRYGYGIRGARKILFERGIDDPGAMVTRRSKEAGRDIRGAWLQNP